MQTLNWTHKLHNYSTRVIEQFVLPRYDLSSQNDIVFRVAKLYDIKSCDNISRFMYMLRENLLSWLFSLGVFNLTNQITE